MWIWRAETGLWEKDPAAPLDGFQGNLLGIAFDPSNPALGYAVGQSGVLLSYGKSWTQEEALPSGFSEANFTSVAFAGSQAMVVAEHDLLVNEGSGWKVEPEVHALLASLPSAPQLDRCRRAAERRRSARRARCRARARQRGSAVALL